uniref:Uncharacterized protein n=1 Tax=Rhizophora mucronata TaxID=61149 RepID=A0A2P2Q276_RHIMU
MVIMSEILFSVESST